MNGVVDHSSIKKEDILNIRQYLMIKTNKKYCLDLLKTVIALLTSVAVNASGHIKCVSSSNQKCTTQPTLIN